jgi:hypothetical protein
MQKALEGLGYKLERIYGPNTAHKYEKNAKKQLAARLDEIAAKGRDPSPTELHFQTYTLRYNQMRWLTVDELERHWQPARVDATPSPDRGCALKTTNVAALTVDTKTLKTALPIQIDGQVIVLPSKAIAIDTLNFAKTVGKWHLSPPPATSGLLRKRHALQGPIDDAFLDAFLIVKPTGQPLNDATAKWTAHELAHATTEWRKIFRGEAPVKSDTDVTGADIVNNNLVLFGDPSSNSILKKIADQLPIKWTKESITLGDRAFPADRHALIAIYLNPLNPKKYIVLNSGFTFRQADHKTNSRQVAKLPDYAVIDLTTPPDDKQPGAIPAAGFFDEQWKLQKDDGKPE